MAEVPGKGQLKLFEQSERIGSLFNEATQLTFFSSLKAGLHIGRDYLSFVVLRPKGRGFQVKKYEVVPLSKNAVRQSPVEANISSVEEVRDAMKKIFADFPKLKSISLSLPDLSSRMILIEIKNKIPPLNELNQMIKWNMEQKFITDIGSSRLTHQVISQSHQSFKNPDQTPGSEKYFFVLGIAVLESILSEYESLLVSTDKIPTMVNNASFFLFNLYHDLILKMSGHGNFLFVTIMDQYFTLMVFEKKILRYIRTVGLRTAENGQEEEKREIDEKNQFKMFQEVESSLSYHFKEVFSRSEIQLYIAGPQKMPGFGPQIIDQLKVQVSLLRPGLLIGLEELEQLEGREIDRLSPAIAAAAGGLD